MFLRLLPLFLIVPAVDLYILIVLGKNIGVLNTFLIIIGAGVLGVYLLKHQGFQTMIKVRTSLAGGQVPGNEVLDGLLIIIGGVFLLTPGLLTDLAGFSLLFPWSRRLYREFLKYKLYYWIKNGKLKIFY